MRDIFGVFTFVSLCTTSFQINACKMAGMQTPRTLGRPENISNVFDCFTEASMLVGKSYCREKTRNQSRFISFVPDMVAEVEEQEESLEAVVGAPWQVGATFL